MAAVRGGCSWGGPRDRGGNPGIGKGPRDRGGNPGAEGPWRGHGEGAGAGAALGLCWGGCAAGVPGAAPGSLELPPSPRRMYRKEKSIQLKSSSAALYNNLSVLRLPGRQLACFSAVHGPSVNVVSAAADGVGFSHRQLQAKEGGMAVSTSVLTQVRGGMPACLLGSRGPPVLGCTAQALPGRASRAESELAGSLVAAFSLPAFQRTHRQEGCDTQQQFRQLCSPTA